MATKKSTKKPATKNRRTIIKKSDLNNFCRKLGKSIDELLQDMENRMFVSKSAASFIYGNMWALDKMLDDGEIVQAKDCIRRFLAVMKPFR